MLMQSLNKRWIICNANLKLTDQLQTVRQQIEYVLVADFMALKQGQQEHISNNLFVCITSDMVLHLIHIT